MHHVSRSVDNILSYWCYLSNFILDRANLSYVWINSCNNIFATRRFQNVCKLSANGHSACNSCYSMHTSETHEKTTEGDFRSNCRCYTCSQYSNLYLKIVRSLPLQIARTSIQGSAPPYVHSERRTVRSFECPDCLCHFVPYKGVPQPIAPLYSYFYRVKPPYDYNHTEVKLSYDHRPMPRRM